MNRLSSLHANNYIMKWKKSRQYKIYSVYSLLSVLPSTQALLSGEGIIRQTKSFSSVTRSPLIHNYNQYDSLDKRRQNLLKLWMSSTSSTTKTNSTTSVLDETGWDEPEAIGEEGIENHDIDENDQRNTSPLMDEYKSWSRALDNAIKSLKKKRTSLESELKKAQGVEDTVARAQLLTSNLWAFSSGVKSATVQDWENGGVEVELVLDPNYDTASAEADALFTQARKLKRGSQVVGELLEETADAWDLLQETQLDLKAALLAENQVDQGRLALIQDRLERTSRTTKFKAPSMVDPDSKSASKGTNRRPSKPDIGSPASNIRKLISPGGCIVLVGRNRRGNENLSLSIARGNDIWMHSRGCPGAHVIIQNRRGSPTPTPECIQFAANLAIFYSDFRSETKAMVTAAEPKHLQKPRGAPLGAIKVREEWKTFVGFPDQVPDELKIAREESGQSDEYRSIDKAKHRRRTKQLAKEEREKRKKAIKEKKNSR